MAHCADTDLSFDEAYILAQFYYDYLNTNSIIDDAEKLAYENPGLLKELAATLNDESAQGILAMMNTPYYNSGGGGGTSDNDLPRRRDDPWRRNEMGNSMCPGSKV